MKQQTYEPNFSDPRVQRKAQAAVDWVTTYLRSNRDQWLASREIQRHFGSLSRPLGIWLRERLLICTNPHYNSLAGTCKSYRLNANGLNFVKGQLGLDIDQVTIPKEIENELITGELVYKTQNHRDYHWLQNLPKRIKQQELNRRGYKYEYDIECAAQTLLLQHAQHLGLKSPTPALTEYIEDRQSVRQTLSKQLGLPTDVVKKILTAIVNGAAVSAWYQSQIFALVNYNRLMITEIQNNQWIQQYQRDLRLMWKKIRSSRVLEKSQRFNAKMKSETYRVLEDSVRSVIKKHLRKNKVRALIEHDGWSCDTAIETNQLCFEIKTQTGFVVKFDWTIYGSEAL